jgi:hypothetical protein
MCQFYVSSEMEKFKWASLAVYGAAKTAKNPRSAELVRICEGEPLPMLVLGDLILDARRKRKKNDNLQCSMDLNL